MPRLGARDTQFASVHPESVIKLQSMQPHHLCHSYNHSHPYAPYHPRPPARFSVTVFFWVVLRLTLGRRPLTTGGGSFNACWASSLVWTGREAVG